ncbi:MAG TPA: FkbM family methyltransferase [Anaerolineae bacterium]|nr:FkbM family methyltransferase [Anaerolineae bacterium]
MCPTHSSGIALMKRGIFEPQIIKIIRTYVRKGYHYIDIGANIGIHLLAAAFARISNNQEFIAFEPESAIFSILKRNCELNRLNFVDLREEGVGDQDVQLLLNISPTKNKGKHSFLSSKELIPGYKVKVQKIDSIFYGENINKPYIIKIDTEGFEYKILEGGRKFFKEITECAVIIEVTPADLKLYNKCIQDVVNILKKSGFNNWLVIGDNETFNDSGKMIYSFFNMLFIKGNKTMDIYNYYLNDIDFLSVDIFPDMLKTLTETGVNLGADNN